MTYQQCYASSAGRGGQGGIRSKMKGRSDRPQQPCLRNKQTPLLVKADFFTSPFFDLGHGPRGHVLWFMSMRKGGGIVVKGKYLALSPSFPWADQEQGSLLCHVWTCPRQRYTINLCVREWVMSGVACVSEGVLGGSGSE